jgi:carbon storage regulator
MAENRPLEPTSSNSALASRRAERKGDSAMVILTRKVREEIVIEGGIRVIVLDAKGSRVRIGILAPPSVQIDRAEVRDRRTALESREGHGGIR